MTKSKDKKREKVSVASEIDLVEERRLRCQDNIEKAEFRRRRDELSDHERQSLEDEITLMNERVQNYDKELENDHCEEVMSPFCHQNSPDQSRHGLH
ncbi:hypothetical protein UPYG_G00257380 [Umbra pygmaea]|uniref:Coiled-coil domain-containing protein 167 n=1 Tax=Umbra pygmaea TaxID=75934 RepID=A0ABD0W8M5_UMBPY